MSHFKIILLFITFFPDFIAATNAQIRMPAEWEKQETVWLSWFGAKRRDSVTSRVIEALQPHVKIAVGVWDDSVTAPIKKSMSAYNIDTNKVRIFVDPDASYWLRDHAVFVKDGDKLKVVNFNWSDYGQHPDLSPVPDVNVMKLSGEFDVRLATLLKLPVIKSDYVFEAGGIETNGNGTFMIIREMALQRNPGKTILEIENELKRTVGAKKKYGSKMDW